MLRPATTVQLSLRLPPTVDAGERSADAAADYSKHDPPYGARCGFESGAGVHGWNAPPIAPWLEPPSTRHRARCFGKQCVAMGEGGTIPFMAMLGAEVSDAPVPDHRRAGPALERARAERVSRSGDRAPPHRVRRARPRVACRTLTLPATRPACYERRMANDIRITVTEHGRRRRASSGSAWEPVVGYSRAVRHGDVIAVTGTVGIAADGTFPPTVGAQTERARWPSSTPRSRRWVPGSTTHPHAPLRHRHLAGEEVGAVHGARVRRDPSRHDHGRGGEADRRRRADRDRSRRHRRIASHFWRSGRGAARGPARHPPWRAGCIRPACVGPAAARRG